MCKVNNEFKLHIHTIELMQIQIQLLIHKQLQKVEIIITKEV